MGRKQYSHLRLTCHRGINQLRGLATLEECAEALNVWAPDGIIQQRPGYVGAISFPVVDCSDTTPSTGVTKTFITLDEGGSYVNYAHAATMILDDWKANEFWYVGFSVVDGDYSGITGSRKLLGFDASVSIKPNGNEIRYESSYWNGTEFVPFRVMERNSYILPSTQGYMTVVSPHIGMANAPGLFFCPPGDWATSTINGVTAFFIQLKLKPSDGTAIASSDMSGEVEWRNQANSPWRLSPESNTMRGLFVGQFPSTRRYIAVSNNDTTMPSRVRWMIGSDFEFSDMIVPDFETLDYDDDAPATHAIIPQFGEGFIAYGGRVKRYSIRDDWPAHNYSDEFATDAVKEANDFAVGPEAPFDPDYISTLPFPGGNYIVYFQNKLWIAGSLKEPFTVRWSVGLEFYKVWTETSYDILMEDDNSPITGLSPLGEHMIVFKRDSIWMMVNTGVNPVTDALDYESVKIVDGVGCISHASIQQIKGRLFFLAEDGVYVFDGTPNIQKMSDRISTTVASINNNRAAFAASAHWKTHNCYLLSVATGGAYDNNKTLVYDYRNDAWWIWDIPASLWLNDETGSDEEALYFTDNHLCMHRMGVGNTDHGQAITSKVVTQRIGEGDNVRRTVRQVEVNSDNKASSLTVAVRANDDSNGDDSGTLTLTDDSEAKYADNLLFTVTTNYVLDRNRARRMSFRKQGDWLQVFISHNTHDTPMSIRGIDLGMINGTRR